MRENSIAQEEIKEESCKESKEAESNDWLSVGRKPSSGKSLNQMLENLDQQLFRTIYAKHDNLDD
jgi:hypothetical protein